MLIVFGFQAPIRAFIRLLGHEYIVEIRNASLDDLDILWEFEKEHRRLDVKQLGEELGDFYNYGFGEKDKLEYFSELKEILSRDDRLILLAEEEKVAVGFIIGEIKDLFRSKKGHIAELFIAEKHRSKGYG